VTAAELFDRASKRAREGDYEKASQHYERGLAIDALQTTARRDLAMARMARGDTVDADAGAISCSGTGECRSFFVIIIILVISCSH
jgi:Tfp pilus assembly protein PilF